MQNKLTPIILSLACCFCFAADARAESSRSCGKSNNPGMPQGADLKRLDLLDEGKRVAVYTSVAGVDDDERSPAKLPVPMRKLVTMSNEQLRRIFSDIVIDSRRFTVFDSRAAVTADYSTIMIDMQVTDASQRWVNAEPTRRRALTQVDVSVKMKDLYTGEDLFGFSAAASGTVGMVSGDGTLLTSADDVNGSEIRESLAADYTTALKRALMAAEERIEFRLRPMGRVLSVRDCNVNILAGSQSGLQPKDELVVFRASRIKLGERTLLDQIEPLALIACTSGVGTETSLCAIVETAGSTRPVAGDYVIITDKSLKRSREK